MKKTRKSLFLALALGGVAVVIYLFGVQPTIIALARERTRLDELRNEQLRVNSDLRRSDNVKKELADLDAALIPYREAMLTPLLESYSMRAKSLLDPLALGAGLSELEYADEPFRALPVPRPLPRQLHTRAAVRLGARGTYQEAISFLLRLENELPLISLQSLSITAGQQPTRQTIEMVLEWPAKGGLTRK